MPRWDAALGDTFLIAWIALCTFFVGSLLAGSIMKQLGLEPTDGWASVIAVLGFQGSMIAVLAVFALYRRSLGRPLPPTEVRPAEPLADRALVGAAVFCVAMPFVVGTSYLSTLAMNSLGLPIDNQELANIFATADSPLLVLALTVVAVIVVPVSEEVLFRAGVFRILARYLPHWAAVLISALAFAALHGSMVHFIPLTVLGAIFALAYERSGSLLVPITAHALFNLNSIIGLLAGLGATS